MVLARAFVPLGDIGTKLKLATYALPLVTEDIVRNSFAATGLWPMNYRLVQWAEQSWMHRGLDSSDTADMGEHGASEALRKLIDILFNASQSTAMTTLCHACDLLLSADGTGKVLREVSLERLNIPTIATGARAGEGSR